MHRRDFLKTGAVLTSAGGLTLPAGQSPAAAADPARLLRGEPNMTIRDYLSREGQTITDAALADFADETTWRRLLPQKRRQYLEMMGLDDLPPVDQRPPVKATVTGVVERKLYRIEKLYYESLPRLYVAANLYVPKHVAPPFPAVLYVCGHSATQKVHYQAHPRRFAELGFAALAVDSVQLGEVRGYHHGCYREGWWHWYSRGYTPAGMELLNGIRGLDLLAAREDLDGSRLGVTGISGGGAASWWIAAGDERVGVAAPVCGTATLASHIRDRTIDGHCDCMWWTNTYRWDLADLAALIAPRPFMIASANRDGIFTLASIRQVYQQARRLYGLLGASDNLHLVETPGPHSYHEKSRTALFSLFLKHLQGKEVPPEQVGDIDDSPGAQESEDTLRVFVNGPLPEDLTPTIHEHRLPPAAPPDLPNGEALARERASLIEALREKTFGAFPTDPPPLDTQVEFEFDTGPVGCRFAFTSEEGWRLHGRLTVAQDVPQPAPAVVGLRLPGEDRHGTERFLGQLKAPWARVSVEPRGTGDTSWGDDLNWHLRRAAAWTGRTLASMRVWDTLRALAAVRELPYCQGRPVALAGRGEMAAVVLYAALLDGEVSALFLESPPPTQNAPGEPDGRGPALEMLNCLRLTDLPQVAGLLCPTPLVLAGAAPDSYEWTEKTYAKLGDAGLFQRVGKLSEWKASG